MDFSRRIRLILAYDGTDFHGWQKQKSGMGIQNVVETQLTKLFDCPIKTAGSGRTDSGVHAIAQNLHFDLPFPMQHPDLVYALNRLLPRSIRVLKASFAPEQFHSQISAKRKTYRYRVLQSDIACPLRRAFTWWVPQKLSCETLNSLNREIIGEKDFKSFQSAGTEVRTTVRKIEEALWTTDGDELVFTITGNGFLKQMVRNIVGAMVEFALHADNPLQEFQKLVALKDRTKLGPPAPPQGLCLCAVEYPADIENQCTPLPKKITI